VPKKPLKPNEIGKKSIEHSSISAKQSIPKVQASLGTLIEAEAPKSQCRLKRQKLAYDDLILKSPKDNYGVNPV
jgi:hypothetical protein